MVQTLRFGKLDDTQVGVAFAGGEHVIDETLMMRMKARELHIRALR